MTKTINFEEITHKQIGQQIRTTATILKVDQPQLRITTATFECVSCLRLHTVEQRKPIMREPPICQECGGTRFELLPNESKYTSSQEIIIGKHNTAKTLIIVLEEELVSYDDLQGISASDDYWNIKNQMEQKDF